MTLRSFHLLFVATSMTIGLASCTQPVATGSFVHEDGSIDRSIVFHHSDSSNAVGNMFGASAAKGWQVTLKRDTATGKEFEIQLARHFADTSEINRGMSRTPDSLFRIRSGIEFHSSLFYQYIDYHDTYQKINRLHSPSVLQCLTKEDSAFIARLPSDHQSLSGADSLTLSALDKRIEDECAAQAIMEKLTPLFSEYLKGKMKSSGRDNPMNTERIVRILLKAYDDDKLDRSLDSLKIGVDSKRAKQDIDSMILVGSEGSIKFMSTASAARYGHVIEMPWTIIESNADSLVNNQAFWFPRYQKFLFSDYRMRVIARKPNVSALIMLAASFVAVVVALVYYRRNPRRA